MHELGHSLSLTHGGFYYDPQVQGSYIPTIEPNCKPNHLSVMNYMFQVDLLDNGSGTNVPDYSRESLPPLNITSGATAPISGFNSFYKSTSWYAPTAGSGASQHCDGSPVLNNPQQMLRVTH